MSWEGFLHYLKSFFLNQKYICPNTCSIKISKVKFSGGVFFLNFLYGLHVFVGNFKGFY